MAAPPGIRIALGLATLVVALAAGVAVADEGPNGGSPPPQQAAAAEPPWLLLSAVAALGTLAVGGAGVLWARMLERAGAVPRLR